MNFNYEKFRKTKTKNHLKKLDKSNIEEKTNSNLRVSKARKNIRITIDEYIGILKEKGWTQKDFQANGYSKHQIAFYSWMLKGKNPIDRNIFHHEYCINMAELDEISKIYKIPRGYVTQLREYYGIKREGHKRRLRLKEQKELTYRQKQIILGGLLGDGKRHNNNCFAVTHSVKQIDYCKWKMRELKDHTLYKDVLINKNYDNRYDSFNDACFFSTLSHQFLENVYEKIYNGKTKIIDRSFIEEIDELGLAVWFMDDGSTDFGHRFENDRRGSCKLMTCSFTYEENLLLRMWFRSRWGIVAKIKFKEKNKYPYLTFGLDESEKLINIIKPHIIKSMRYKVDKNVSYKKYIEDKKYLENVFNTPTKSKFNNLSNDSQEKIVEEVCNYYRNSGFPYYSFSNEESSLIFSKLVNLNTNLLISEDLPNGIKQNTRCSNMIQYFLPHIFNMACKGSLSPVEVFNDNDKFKDAIFRRLKYGGTCTPSGVRGALKTYRNNRAVSSFMPSTAKFIYDKLLNDNSKVLDFCSGFGGRMLGALASKKVSSYTGVDPLKLNIDGLNRMVDCVGTNDTEVNLINSTAEDALFSLDDKYDMVFTSPPYFDKEIYSKDGSQCYDIFKTYDQWFNMWLMPMIRRSVELLKDDGLLVLSLGKTASGRDINKDLEQNMKGFLNIKEIFQMETGVVEYNRKKGAKKSFPIYVFSKG